MDRAGDGPVRPHPVHHLAHHHRRGRDAAAVGSPARCLSAQLHDAFAANRRLAGAIIRIAPFILLIACFGVFIERGRLLGLLRTARDREPLHAVGRVHSRLYELRPPKQQLTLFYLAMSIGGALGGLFCALVAPLIFNWTYEHLLLLNAAAYLMVCRSPFDRFIALWDGGKAARGRNHRRNRAVALLAIVGKRSVRPANFES